MTDGIYQGVRYFDGSVVPGPGKHDLRALVGDGGLPALFCRRICLRYPCRDTTRPTPRDEIHLLPRTGRGDQLSSRLRRSPTTTPPTPGLPAGVEPRGCYAHGP